MQPPETASTSNCSSTVDFFASENAPLNKQRRVFLIGGAIGVAIAIVPVIQRPGAVAFIVALAALIYWSIDRLLRRQLRFGQPIVTLSDESIASPNLSGKRKMLHWKEIEFACLTARQGQQHIEFLLHKSTGQRDRRSFWSGVNHARPSLPLATFSPVDQERLFGEILKRHIRSCSADHLERLTAPLNELRENQAFEEKLKSLQPHTWITFGLIAINVAIWCLTLTQGAGFSRSPTEMLLQWGGNAASEVQKGEWWRLLSATFLHSGFMHVAMNMLGLYSAGIWVERIYGKRLFTLIYLASGLMGSVLSLYFSAQNAVSVGASGAVFGVTGAFLVAVAQNRSRLPKLFSQQTLSGMGLFIVYSLLQGFGTQGIDNAAHIGGLIGGGLAAFLLPERFDLDQFKRVFARRTVVTCLTIGALTIAGVRFAPEATLDLGRIVASQEILMRGLQKFDQSMLELKQEFEAMKSGKLSEQEGDERSRTVMAPKFRAVVADLAQVAMFPSDPRQPFVQDIKRMSELLAEQLEMESVFNSGTQHYEPVDPSRAKKLEVELVQVSQRVAEFTNKANSKKR